jgi:hypothetical protein
MTESITIQCPHCGETFETLYDASEGDCEFVTDCEVCCRPMEVTVTVSEGTVLEVQVEGS